jgi:hypothetical protein
MRDFSYSPPGSSKRYGRSLVLTPWASAFVPGGLALVDGTVRGSSSRFFVEFPLERYELYAHMFLFTDNGTAEAAFFKGTSKSEKLFDLELRLHKIHMHGEIVLHLVHVAGRRIISQGTDGLSRGDPAECLGGIEDSLNHVPLHLNVLERQPRPLIEWVDSWLGLGPEITRLSPDDWYLAGHMKPCCVWTPAPCAADAALGQLAKANHKHPKHTHLVIIPRLMTARWQKMLLKICDLYFTVPVGTDVWSFSQHEPLTIGLSQPLCRHAPWKLKGTPMLVGVERMLRELPPDNPGWGRDILCQLLKKTRRLDCMPEGLVRPLLCSPR